MYIVILEALDEVFISPALSHYLRLPIKNALKLSQYVLQFVPYSRFSASEKTACHQNHFPISANTTVTVEMFNVLKL